AAEAEKQALLDRLSKRSGLTDEQILEKASHIVNRAVENGLTSVQVFRFPNHLCSDNGRAIDQNEDGLTAISGIERIDLTTGSGIDTITGGAFDDRIVAGAGNDTIDARTRAGGTDVVDGGAGIDTLVVNASAETQSVSLNLGLNPSYFVDSMSGHFRVEGYSIE